MQIETIQMDPRIARIHCRDYQKKLREHRDLRKQQLAERASEAGKELGRIRIEKSRLEKEDEELARAYRAMALGHRVLNLTRVLKGAGVDKQYLPVLAIAGAGWRVCHFRPGDHQDAVFSEDFHLTWDWNRGNSSYKPAHKSVAVPRHTFPAETTNTDWRQKQNLPNYPVRAMVPAIPVALRPAGDLRDYYILWEAKWTPAAPEDPILLKRLSDNIYIVLAQWDLTPVEQSVLEGRLRG